MSIGEVNVKFSEFFRFMLEMLLCISALVCSF